MKIKTISLSVGCALAAMAGAANALPLSTVGTNASQTSAVYASGSSALDPAIGRLASRACVAGTLDEYTFKNTYAFYCQARNALPSGAKYLVFNKYSGNGSFNGVVGVAENSNTTYKFNYIDMASLAANSANCTASSVFTGVATSSGDTIGIPAYTIHSCASAGATSQHYADFGFSDVEATVFASAADAKKITASPVVTEIFAVPVTIAGRNAMQSAQFGTASACIGQDTIACMPSLSLSQLGGVYTGVISNWSTLGVPLTTGTNALTDDQIYISMRQDTANLTSSSGSVQSGTQAIFQKVVTQDLCAVGVNAFVGYTDGGSGNGADCGFSSSVALGPNGPPFTVYGGNGTGDMQTCLLNHNNNNRGAFGVAGGVDIPISGSTDYGYRFIAIQGVPPTVDAVANGLYPLWSEATVNVRPSSNPTPTGADPLAVVALFKADFSSATVLSDVDKAQLPPGFSSTTGYSGLASLGGSTTPSPAYSNELPVSPSAAAATPYNLYSRNGNSCQPGILQQAL